MRLLLLLCFVFLIYGNAHGQFQLTAGFQAGYPLKPQEAYYHAISAGLEIEAAYRLPQSALYPSFQAGVAYLDLPLNTKAGNSFTVSLTAHRYAIGLSRAITDDIDHKSFWVAGCGIGVDIVSPDRQNVMIGGNTSGLTLAGGDAAAIYPFANINLQYRSFFRYGSKWFYNARAELSGMFLANNKNIYYINPLIYDNEAQLSNILFWPAITVQIGRAF